MITTYFNQNQNLEHNGLNSFFHVFSEKGGRPLSRNGHL